MENCVHGGGGGGGMETYMCGGRKMVSVGGIVCRGGDILSISSLTHDLIASSVHFRFEIQT